MPAEIVVLGGGVGGTLTANLLDKALGRTAHITVVDPTGMHDYQPGYLYVALGEAKGHWLTREERSLLRGRVDLAVEEAVRIHPSLARREVALQPPVLGDRAAGPAPRTGSVHHTQGGHDMSTTIARTLDLKGLACPLPIAKTAQAIRDLSVGELIEVYATDPGSVPDFAAWCTTTGHALIERSETDGVFRFLIQKTR